MAELKYEITEEIGVLSENAKGWKKELNMVSWNEHDPKYDIREWAPDHERMGKGVREQVARVRRGGRRRNRIVREGGLHRGEQRR